MKAKGDDFFRSGDIRSALNAYSAAIDADDSFVSGYSNRAACYLKLNMNIECKLDCDKAIDLLNEELLVEQISIEAKTEGSEAEKAKLDKLYASLVKLLLRRGACECSTGSFTSALNDYTQARSKTLLMSGRKISTLAAGEFNFDSLDQDISRLKILTSAEALKLEGDVAVSEDSLDLAVNKYTEALKVLPLYVSCISNRSACKMSKGDLDGCIEDCTEALTLLEVDPNSQPNHLINSEEKHMLQNILPPKNSEKRKNWVIKTLTRRGVAHSQLNRLEEAIQDFQQAVGYDPKNEALVSDLNKLKTFRESKKKN